MKTVNRTTMNGALTERLRLCGNLSGLCGEESEIKSTDEIMIVEGY